MSRLDRFGDLVMHSDTEDVVLSPTFARAVQPTADILCKHFCCFDTRRMISILVASVVKLSHKDAQFLNHFHPYADISSERLLTGSFHSMAVEFNTIPSRQPRFEVKMSITVSGIDKNGCYFSAAAETVNGSTGGMGLLLDRELYPFTTLVLSIPRDQRTLQIQTEVRHISPYKGNQRLVGVKFRKAAIV